MVNFLAVTTLLLTSSYIAALAVFSRNALYKSTFYLLFFYLQEKYKLFHAVKINISLAS